MLARFTRHLTIVWSSANRPRINTNTRSARHHSIIREKFVDGFAHSSGHLTIALSTAFISRIVSFNATTIL